MVTSAPPLEFIRLLTEGWGANGNQILKKQKQITSIGGIRKGLF